MQIQYIIYKKNKIVKIYDLQLFDVFMNQNDVLGWGLYELAM